MDDSPTGKKRIADEPNDLEPDSSYKRQKSEDNINNNNNSFLPPDDDRGSSLSSNANPKIVISLEVSYLFVLFFVLQSIIMIC